MPDADVSSWTAPEDIAKQLIEWAEMPESRLGQSGNLIEVVTENYQTSYRVVGA